MSVQSSVLIENVSVLVDVARLCQWSPVTGVGSARATSPLFLGDIEYFHLHH